jgi:hypothetical protein
LTAAEMQSRLISSEWLSDPEYCSLPSDGSTLRLVAADLQTSAAASLKAATLNIIIERKRGICCTAKVCSCEFRHLLFQVHCAR